MGIFVEYDKIMVSAWHGSISRALRRYTREYAVAPPDNTELGTVSISLFIKYTR